MPKIRRILLKAFIHLIFGFVFIFISGIKSDVTKNNISHTYSDSLYIFYNNLLLESYQSLDLPNFDKYSKKLLTIINESEEANLVENFAEIARTYNIMGAFNYRVGKWDEAVKFYDLAQNIYLKNFGKDYLSLGMIYINKGILYMEQGDYSNSMRYYKAALNILEANIPGNENRLIPLYINLGILYHETQDYENAIYALNKAEELSKQYLPHHLTNIYGNLGICYHSSGKINIAKQYYEKAIKKSKLFYGDINIDHAIWLMNYGVFTCENYNTETGLKLLFKAYEIYIKTVGRKHERTSFSLFNIATNIREKDLNKSLYYFQKALIGLSHEFNDSSIFANPVIEDVKTGLVLSDVLRNKSRTLHLKFRETNDFRYLRASFETLELAVENIEKIREGFQNEESMLQLAANEKNTFLDLVEYSIELYEHTGNNYYKYKAFEYAEKSKASTLLASIRNIGAIEFGGIPSNLITFENNLKREISFYEELLYEEKRKEDVEADKIRQWEESLFRLNQKKDSLINSLEKNYPEYYSLKYDTRVTDVKTIQSKLPADKALLEYVTFDSAIYVFAITKERYEVFKVGADSSFFSKIDIIHAKLTNADFSNHGRQQYEEYVDAAYVLHEKLISPAKEIISGHELLIVPDERLVYVPFEILLTEKANVMEMDYRTLPYLIRKTATGYSYSATLYFTHRSSRTVNRKLLAFAPKYDTPDIQNENPFSSRQVYRERLFPIPGAREEVKAISNIFNSSIFLDSMATEANFKKYAGNYHILHLAMHTVVDNDNPMYSKLVFTHSDDTLEDGLLNTYEIYNMKLQADLAVLSSCNTGKGEIKKGEGVMSLARGFLYAGCPSIVMSLWEVEDNSGVKLMTNFYHNLFKGKSKSKSLRNAKLDFLNNADALTSHPYFWSGYVSIGDNSPVKRKNRHYLPYVIIATFIILGIGLWVYKRN